MTSRSRALEHVAQATLRLPRLEGQGVVVPGNLILTAAHCIGWTAEGDMALGDFYIEDVETRDGRKLRVQPLALEPVSDVAVLGSLDDQTFSAEATAFEDFCAEAPWVALCTSEFPLFQPFPVWIRSHEGAWIEGTAQQCAPEALYLAIDTQEQIQRGTSGGPVVNQAGSLIGIVSTYIERECAALVPRPHLAMPARLLRRILRRQAEEPG